MQRLLATVAVLGTVLSGCGKGPVRDSAPPLQRLSFEPSDREGEDTGFRTVRQWSVGEELPESWTVESDKHRVALVPGPPGEEDRHALILRGSERASVRIRKCGSGPIDALAVTVMHRGQVDLRVLVSVKGGRSIRTPSRRLRGKGEWDTLVFVLPEPVAASEDLNDVRFLINRRPEMESSVQVGSIAVLDRPLSARLPPPARPGVVTVEGFARPAVGLTPESPLRVVFRAPADGRFELSYALPTFARRDAEALNLALALEGGEGRRLTRRFAIPTGESGGEDPWRTASIPLESLAGRDVTATLRLEGEGARLCALGRPRVVRPVEEPRTVLLITSDTHRADHVGYQPDRASDVRTPVLDALAERGLYFSDCWAATNITNPSHVSLMTGAPPRDTGITDNLTPLAEEAATLAELFRDAGFLTLAATSVAHLGHDQSGLGQGFDRLYAPPDRHVDSSETLAHLLGWLDEARGQPLFLWLHVFDAHTPYEPPEELKLYYDRDERDPYDPSLPQLSKEQLARWDPEIRDLDYIRAHYKAEVTYLDLQVKKILDHPRLERAVIAFTSDHGESLGLHGSYFNHSGLYPDTLAVPLILAWPGGPRGETETLPVRLTDVGRTLLDLAELEHVPFEGTSLVARAEARADERPRFALSSHSLTASIQTGQWFFLMHLRGHGQGGSHEKHESELYDLEADPDCLEDLIDQRMDVARKLRPILIEWLEETPAQDLAQRSSDVDVETLTQLAALGYAVSGDPESSRATFDRECACAWCQRFEAE